MIDRGLLLSMVAIAAGVAALSRLAPPRLAKRDSLMDLLSLPLLAGVASARLSAVALDDPSALGRPRDLLLIRGGMELWPGLLAAALTLVVIRRRDRDVSALSGLVDLAPYVLWALAIYESTCVLRDGCFGPASALGLRPPGVAYRQVPIGLAVAAALGTIGHLVRRLGTSDRPVALVSAIGGLAAVRSVAAIWLPRITTGLTRQHRESLVVLAASVAAGMAILIARIRSQRRRGVPTLSSTNRRSAGRTDDGAPPTEENQECS